MLVQQTVLLELSNSVVMVVPAWKRRIALNVHRVQLQAACAGLQAEASRREEQRSAATDRMDAPEAADGCTAT